MLTRCKKKRKKKQAFRKIYFNAEHTNQYCLYARLTSIGLSLASKEE